MSTDVTPPNQRHITIWFDPTHTLKGQAGLDFLVNPSHPYSVWRNFRSWGAATQQQALLSLAAPFTVKSKKIQGTFQAGQFVSDRFAAPSGQESPNWQRYALVNSRWYMTLLVQTLVSRGRHVAAGQERVRFSPFCLELHTPYTPKQ